MQNDRYYAYVETSARNTGIFWSCPDLKQLKEDIEPYFEFMKKCKTSNMFKGVFCIRFYKGEELIAQWGSW